LVDATSGWLQPGDDVVLAPGNYTLTSPLIITEAIELKGTGAPPATTITSTVTSGSAVVTTSDGVSISDLRIVGQANGSALDMLGGTARRLIVSNSGWMACRVQNGSTLIADTVCATSAPSAPALYVFSAAGAMQQAKLRGVTAVNTSTVAGTGIAVTGYQTASATLDAKSVIASGATSDVAVYAGSSPSSTVTANFDHSNYNTTAPSERATVTAPGSDTNQTWLPGFTDSANLDFSPTSDSPTIDAGAVDGSSGAVDVIGNPRVQGAASDIGAYERDLGAPDAPVVTSPAANAVLDVSPNYSGTAEPNVKVSFMLDGLWGVLTYADDSGDWSIGYMALDAGVHTVVIRTGDDAGNWSPEVTLSFTLTTATSYPVPVSPQPPPESGTDSPIPPTLPTQDVTAPTVSKPKLKTDALKVSIAFAANEPGITFMCKLDKGKFKKCKSPYRAKVKRGKHKLKMYAIDAAGNKSPTKSISWLAKIS
jgi:hypothetical protein